LRSEPSGSLPGREKLKEMRKGPKGKLEPTKGRCLREKTGGIEGAAIGGKKAAKESVVKVHAAVEGREG